MRKVALLATAVVLCLAVVTAAFGISGTQEIEVKVTPPTAKKKKAGAKATPIKLFVETRTAPAADDPAFATKEAVIHFDKGLVFAPASWPSCKQSQVQQDETKCPAASKVGSGSAEGEALGQKEALTVTAFDGPGSNKFELHVVGSTPLQIDSVIEATLKPDSGDFGRKLVVPIPENLQQPLTGVFATLKRFTTTVNKTYKKKGYVSLKPGGCPSSKKLSFKGDFSYTDGTSKSAMDTVACTTK